jgi:hypothetical protein
MPQCIPIHHNNKGEKRYILELEKQQQQILGKQLPQWFCVRRGPRHSLLRQSLSNEVTISYS